MRAPFDLSPGLVHLWRASLVRPAEEVAALFATLSPEERVRAERYRFDLHRGRFIVARGLLRRLLGRYLEVPPEAVQIGYEAGGKPLLVGLPPTSPPITFNLTHSEERALYAFGMEHRIGVDLEEVAAPRNLDGLARRICSPRELAALEESPERARNLLTLWTAKEAYLKASGIGLRGNLTRVEIDIDPTGAVSLVSVDGSSEEGGRWKLERVPLDDGWVGILVGEGDGWEMRLFDEGVEES